MRNRARSIPDTRGLHLQGVGDVELALLLVLRFVFHARFQPRRVRRAVEVRDDHPKSQSTQAHHEGLRAARTVARTKVLPLAWASTKVDRLRGGLTEAGSCMSFAVSTNACQRAQAGNASYQRTPTEGMEYGAIGAAEGTLLAWPLPAF